MSSRRFKSIDPKMKLGPLFNCWSLLCFNYVYKSLMHFLCSPALPFICWLYNGVSWCLDIFACENLNVFRELIFKNLFIHIWGLCQAFKAHWLVFLQIHLHFQIYLEMISILGPSLNTFFFYWSPFCLTLFVEKHGILKIC